MKKEIFVCENLVFENEGKKDEEGSENVREGEKWQESWYSSYPQLQLLLL